MNAEIIAVGSEMLTPQRLDTNSLYLTAELNNLGVEVVLKSVIGDDRERLTDAIRRGFSRHERAARRHFGRRFLRIFLRSPLNEPDDGFERDFHFVARGTCAFATRFNLWAFGHCGGNGVGQLASEPVHDVIHATPSCLPPGRVTGGHGPTTLPLRAGGVRRRKVRIW